MCSVYLSIQIWVWQCGLYLILQQPAKVRDTHLHDMAWVIEILHHSHSLQLCLQLWQTLHLQSAQQAFSVTCARKDYKGAFLITEWYIWIDTVLSHFFPARVQWEIWMPAPPWVHVYAVLMQLGPIEVRVLDSSQYKTPSARRPPVASTHCTCSASEPALECHLSHVCCHAHLCKSDGALLERGVLYTEGGCTFFYLLLHG